jgi:hypothetical protein
MEEYEEYALYANTPYLVNEDVSIEDIESNLLEHGLDYTIDKDLSDKFSTILVGQDKVVHSIRGTDFGEGKDILADMSIALNNPFSKKLINTISAIHGLSVLDSFPKHYRIDVKEDLLNYATKLTEKFYQDQYYNTVKGKEFFMFAEEGPQWSLAEWQEELDTIKNKISKLPIKQREEVKNKFVDVLKVFSYNIIGELTLNKFFKDRIEPEKDKLKRVQEKYKNKEINLVGHSLGSIANILGRENNIKTITLNPAPQDSTKLPHPDSKIYRTYHDPVSYFLYPETGDKEPVIHLEPKNDYGVYNPFHYTQSHFLNNFLPSIKLKSVLNNQLFLEPSITPQVNPEFKIKKKKKYFIHPHRKNLFEFNF